MKKSLLSIPIGPGAIKLAQVIRGHCKTADFHNLVNGMWIALPKIKQI